MSTPQQFRDNIDGSIVEAIQDTAENVFDIVEWVPPHRLRLVDMCGTPAMYLMTAAGGFERVYLNQWIIRRSEHGWSLVGASYFAERFTAVEAQSIEDLFAAPVKVKFWVCPDHRRTGRVEWSGDQARCLTCGRTNAEAVQS